MTAEVVDAGPMIDEFPITVSGDVLTVHFGLLPPGTLWERVADAAALAEFDALVSGVDRAAGIKRRRSDADHVESQNVNTCRHLGVKPHRLASGRLTR